MCNATSLTVYLKLTECFAPMVNVIRPGGNSTARQKRLLKHGTEGQKGAKMARIEFKPTCSACKRQIHGKIDCATFSEKLCGNVIQDYTIEPLTCPYCGALFEEIVMPVSLPYYNEGEEL